MVQRPPAKGEVTKELWVGYISVPDVTATVQKVMALGGRTLLAPRQIPDRGQVALLADPEGAIFSVFQSSSGDPSDYRPELGEWCWAQLFADNVTKATSFYESVIGYQVKSTAGETAYLARGDMVRASVSRSGDANYKPSWLGFINVTDMAATVAKVQALGGAVLVEPQRNPDGTEYAVIADPVGAPVGLLKPTLSPVGKK